MSNHPPTDPDDSDVVRFDQSCPVTIIHFGPPNNTLRQIVDDLVQHFRGRRERSAPSPAAPESDALLSYRERQIARLLDDGKNNAEIGKILTMSPETVKTHRGKIYRKLHIHNVNQLRSKRDAFTDGAEQDAGDARPHTTP